MSTRTEPHTIWHTLGHWLLAVLLGGALLVAGVAVRLSYKPYVLDQFLPSLEHILKTDGITLKLDHLSVGMRRGRLQFTGQGVLLAGPDNTLIATAHLLKVTVANQSFLRLRPVFYNVTLDGAALRGRLTENQLTLGSYTFPISLKPAEKAAADNHGVVELVHRLRHDSLYGSLHSLTLKNLVLDMVVALPNIEGEWRLNETNLFFTRYAGLGERVAVTSLLQHDGKEDAPVYVSAEFPLDRLEANLRARFEHADTSTFMPLLPAGVRDVIQAPINSVEWSSTLGLDNQLKDSRFTLRFGEGKLNLPDLYMAPKPFKEATLKGQSTQTASGELSLQLDQLDVLDRDGLHLELQGTLTGQQQDDMVADLELVTSPSKLAALMNYLPDRHMAHTLAWMNTEMNPADVRIRNFKVALRGNLGQLPFLYEDYVSGRGLLTVDFDFENLSVTPIRGLPPIIGLAGHARMEGDQLTITSADGGTLLTQNLQQVDVSIVNLFRAGEHPYLRVGGHASGPVQEVLDRLYEQLHTDPVVENAQGEHVSDITVELPLKDHVTFDDVKFTVESTIDGLALTIPYLDKPFNAPLSTLHLTQQDLHFNGKGTLLLDAQHRLNGVLDWQEKLHEFGQKTRIAATLTSTGEPLPGLGDALGLKVHGPLEHKLLLTRYDANAFDFDLQTDLTKASLEETKFDWLKDSTIQGQLEMRGRLDDKGERLEVDMLNARAPGLNLMGQLSLSLHDWAQQPVLNFQSFQIGSTNTALSYDSGDLEINGESLDLSRFDVGHGVTTEATLPDGQYHINLERLTLPQGTFRQLSSNWKRKDNAWQGGSLTATIGPRNQPLTVQLEPAAEGNYLRLRAVSGDAGTALKLFGLYDNLREGYLDFSFDMHKQYGLLAFDGNGLLNIKKGYLVKAPIMARILSLLSLQQLLEVQKGILFEGVNVPLIMENKRLKITKAILTGPSLGLRGQGDIDFETNQIHMVGTLVPVSGLNNFLGSIPVLGRVIGGSQGAIMAADFTVHGKVEDPQVSVNPLSIVTPGLLKDIFGVIFE